MTDRSQPGSIVMQKPSFLRDPWKRSIVLLALFGVVIAPAIFGTIIYTMVERQNAIANDARIEQASTVVNYVAATYQRVVDEKAHAKEVYANVVQAGDVQWFDNALGAAQSGQMDHDATLLVDGTGKIQYASWGLEVKNWSPGEILGPVYRSMLDTLVASPVSTTIGSFTRAGNGVAYVAMSEITPLDRMVGKNDAYRSFMLLVYLLDDELMGSLRKMAAWDDLAFSYDPPAGPQLPVFGVAGTTIGYLTWDYPQPGFAAFWRALPLILIGLLFTVVSTLGFLHRSVQAHRRLDAARAEAVMIAECDPLTGLANRRKLHRDIGRRVAEGAPFQVLSLDFDGFKEVNDRLGHRAGDAMLVEMARRMLALCPECGMLARMGGDEFAMLAPLSAEEAEELGHDLVFAISGPFEAAGQTISISASIGIASAMPDLPPDELLYRADLAMDEAKDHKPGAVRQFHARMDRDARRKAELDQEIRDGLERGEFWVAYQPIYSVAEQRVTGVEALARWSHPRRGAVSPGEFIPVAEESRAIIPLGRFVLLEACRAFADSDLRLSVNLSPVQLLDDQLVNKIADILGETGFPAARLELEITEGYLVEQPDRAADVMTRLHELGVKISLDDFGSGYASVGYLRRFPLDKVKIDKSFIDLIGVDEKSRQVVDAMIRLCRAFDIPITAEGVETVEQANTLSAMGCDLLQGYLIGRPGARSAVTPGMADNLLRAGA